MAGIAGRLKRWYITREIVAEFVKKFPGRCLICCYHGYGLREGFIKTGTSPPKHDCIEERT